MRSMVEGAVIARSVSDEAIQNRHRRSWIASLTLAMTRALSSGLHLAPLDARYPFPREIGDIIRHLGKNRSDLLSAWNDHFGT